MFNKIKIVKVPRPQWPYGPELIEESDVGNTQDGFWHEILTKYLIVCGLGFNFFMVYTLVFWLRWGTLM